MKFVGYTYKADVEEQRSMLVKVLKDDTVNKEALLQWLTTHGQKQLVLMSNNKVSALENLDNCQILMEISQRWNLSKYPEEKTLLHSAVKGMFEERKRLSMIETNKLEEKNSGNFKSFL